MKTLASVLLTALTLSPTTLAQQTESDRALETVITTVQSNYAMPMSREQVVDHTIRALLKDLDPYSAYMNPSEWAVLKPDRMLNRAVEVLLGPRPVRSPASRRLGARSSNGACPVNLA